jgi:hypothetical protein
MAFAQPVEVAAAPDPRLVYSNKSPSWLGAVGKLYVPGIKYEQGHGTHHRENCSATLVTDRPRASADTIITAWHCIEHYKDLSKPITFTIFPGSMTTMSFDAYRLEDGGAMTADWAILKLIQPIPVTTVTALITHSDRADPRRPVLMAGYSADNGMGNGGGHLTYDPSCTIVRQQFHRSDSNCRAFRGASGGAVIQVSAQGEPLLSGVISQGNGTDLSIFVPVAGFRRAINRSLQ